MGETLEAEHEVVGLSKDELMVVHLLSQSFDLLVRQSKVMLVGEPLMVASWNTWAGHPLGLFFKEECRLLDIFVGDRKILINR